MHLTLIFVFIYIFVTFLVCPINITVFILLIKQSFTKCRLKRRSKSYYFKIKRKLSFNKKYIKIIEKLKRKKQKFEESVTRVTLYNCDSPVEECRGAKRKRDGI